MSSYRSRKSSKLAKIDVRHHGDKTETVQIKITIMLAPKQPGQMLIQKPLQI